MIQKVCELPAYKSSQRRLRWKANAMPRLRLPRCTSRHRWRPETLGRSGLRSRGPELQAPGTKSSHASTPKTPNCPNRWLSCHAASFSSRPPELCPEVTPTLLSACQETFLLHAKKRHQQQANRGPTCPAWHLWPTDCVFEDSIEKHIVPLK